MSDSDTQQINHVLTLAALVDMTVDDAASFYKKTCQCIQALRDWIVFEN